MKIIISLGLIIFINVVLFAQDVQVNDVKTPLNHTVNSWLMEEESDPVREALDNDFSISNPDAVQYDTYDKSSSTNRFNCHAYAWYMSQKSPILTDPRWIGYYSGNTDEHIYWEKGSYIEVATETYPGMVSWSNGDHSAITTSTPGKWKSKWSYGPLCLHDWDDSPFLPLVFKYYAPFKVNGHQVVCSGNTATFSTPDYKGCTFNWTYDTNLLDTVSGQGTNTFIVKPKNSFSSGEAWVKLELTIDLDEDVTRSITKSIWVGPSPAPEDFELTVYDSQANIIEPMVDGNYDEDYPGYKLCPGEIYLFHLSVDNHPLNNLHWGISSDIEWYFDDLDYDVIQDAYFGEIAIQIHEGANINGSWLNISANSVCDGQFDIFEEVSFEPKLYCPGTYYMAISPNPTNGETTVSIESNSKEQLVDETMEWGLEVYSPNQTLKEKKIRLKGKSTKINTRNWKEGVYILKAKINKETITGKLVVQ